MTLSHNTFSIKFTPAGGSEIDITSFQNFEETDEGNTTLLQTDAARTITAAYRDAKHKFVNITTTDEEFNNKNGAGNFESGKVGKLVVVKKAKANGGAPTEVRVITETFNNVMIVGVSSGVPSQGNATVVIQGVAFDPAGIAVKTVAIA